jgi:cytoskeletal protein RodZ
VTIGYEKNTQKRDGQADKENHDARSPSESLGSYLRGKRMSRNITLEEVSDSTGISITILQALENEDREELPAEVYIKAFYKKYAQYLEVDYEEVQTKYQQKVQSIRKSERTANFNTVITLKGHEENLVVEALRRLFLPLIIVVLGVLIYWFYKNYLASYNPLGFYQENFPAVFSCFPDFSSYFLT